jgi:transcriptional regulator with XRE-family HTH domain
MSKRTSIIIMTNEARVLKELRVKSGLSMREAATQIGVSSSLVSQIENGRENFPKAEKLVRFLSIYNVSPETFRKRVLNFKEKTTDLEIVMNALPRLSKVKIKLVRALIEQMLKD